VFAAVLDLLVAGQAQLLNRDRLRFFGRELVQQETILVFPDFTMHDEVRKTLQSHNQQMLYQRPQSRFATLTIHRIDIPRAVAANDIQALLYVADGFESTTTCPNVMMVDSAVVDDCDRSFISFGLSSNDCTHLYRHEHSHPLFQIVDDNKGSEYIRLRNDHEYRSDDRRQYGIILRYSPAPDEYPERRWFICAGLGPVATTGAAWYLSRHWRSLAKVAGRASNFAAMIWVGTYTDRVPHLVEVLLDDAQRSAP
jgi:hypothetical protein